MKRPILIFLTFLFTSSMMLSCKSQERCPAYGQEDEDRKQEERA